MLVGPWDVLGISASRMPPTRDSPSFAVMSMPVCSIHATWLMSLWENKALAVPYRPRRIKTYTTGSIAVQGLPSASSQILMVRLSAESIFLSSEAVVMWMSCLIG